ncbi:MAG TPA: hypothetical protein VFC19_06035 [Candidatus Limnocylindrales bacterium]|nr:hypothetical protein [Candidatus Limnocylindrales bacterium]
MSHPRVKLSIGSSAPVKLLTVIVGVIMVLIGTAVALIAYGFTQEGREAITSTVPDDITRNTLPSTTAETGAGIAGAACALLVIGVAAYLMLRVLRTGAWLEGSVLHVRGAMGTKRRDLSKAGISGGTQRKSTEGKAGERVQVIIVADPATGKTLTLPLRGPGRSMLPAEQLRMLANAITNQRSRRGDDDPAFIVAERLRGFARDPFS